MCAHDFVSMWSNHSLSNHLLDEDARQEKMHRHHQQLLCMREENLQWQYRTMALATILIFCKSSHHHPPATTAQVFSWDIDQTKLHKAMRCHDSVCELVTRPCNVMIGCRSDRNSSQRDKKKTFLSDRHCPTWLESGDPPHDIAIAL